MTRIASIEGKITTADGEEVSFSIEPDYGYQQWGNRTAILGQTQPVVAAIVDGLREAEIEVGQPDDDEEVTP